MSIFGKRNKQGHRSVNLAYVDGIKGYMKGAAVAVSINTEKNTLTIVPRAFKNLPEVNLYLDQIIGVNVISEEEIIKKSKSSVGRAIAGGVLLGPLGAIVGGISGVGDKSKSQSKFYMVVNYYSRNEEVRVLSFEIIGASLHWSSFLSELRCKIKKEEIIENEIYL